MRIKTGGVVLDTMAREDEGTGLQNCFLIMEQLKTILLATMRSRPQAEGRNTQGRQIQHVCPGIDIVLRTNDLSGNVCKSGPLHLGSEKSFR